MPRKFILTSTLTVLLGTLIGYFGTHYWSKQSALRNFASLSPTANEQRIMKIGADQISRDYFDIQFTTDSIPAKNSDLSKITVKFTALKDVPAGLNFKWTLGSDMQSSDPLEGTLPAFTVGDEKVYELSAVGFSKESVSYVSFHVTGNLGSHLVKREVLASSRPEDSYEYVVQQQALYEEQFEQKNNSALKIKKSKNSNGYRGKFDPDKIVR